MLCSHPVLLPGWESARAACGRWDALPLAPLVLKDLIISQTLADCFCVSLLLPVTGQLAPAPARLGLNPPSPAWEFNSESSPLWCYWP